VFVSSIKWGHERIFKMFTTSSNKSHDIVQVNSKMVFI
jgi:hypothetical protein